jgi:ketosteroid isomerase-like protein
MTLARVVVRIPRTRDQERTICSQGKHVMTRRTRPPALAAAASAITLLLAACQAPQPATLSTEDEAALRSVFEKAVTTARANDWASFASMFSEDAQYHPPNHSPVIGREAIQKWGEGSPKIEAIEFPNVQVWGAGVYAYGTAAYKITAQGAPEDVGKQLVVFRRDGVDKWQVVGLSWNSNLPVP